MNDFIPIKLFTNGKINPIGLDFDTIRLSVEVEMRGEMESVLFRLYNSLSELESGKPFFQTQLKDLSTTIDATDYKTAQRTYWTAQICVNGKEYLSQPAYFEMGLRIKKEEESWIENPKFDKRVSEFVKAFVLEEVPEFARLYIVGLGYYQSKINGKATDNYFFKPLLTDFDQRKNIDNVDYDEENFSNDKKRISYDTFDITQLLRIGENCLSVLLGTGWYCNDDKLISDPCDRFGYPKLFFQIHLHYGVRVEIIQSDESVLVRNTPRISQLFLGDREDFTVLEKEFFKARICSSPSGKLVWPACEHDAVIKELKPLSSAVYDGVTEYDFGINHSGGVALKVKGERGKKLTLRYYEVKTDGELNPYTSEWIAYDVTGGLASALNETGKKEEPALGAVSVGNPVPIDVVYQKDEYVLSGGEDEIYPLFHFQCYRYLTIECAGKYEILDLASLHISTDIKKDGEFFCSDKFITQYYNAFVLTQQDNMHSGVPSDCPHREKLPYTGDGDLASEASLYTFRAEQFYKKWLQDVIDAQGNNGWVPYTAPNIGGAGGYWWSNVIVSLPLKIYAFSGDKDVLKKAFYPLLNYIDYCNQAHSGDYILKKSFSRWNLGDWLTPDPTILDVDFMNTLAYYSAVDKAGQICEILGEQDKKRELFALKEKIKNAVNTYFYDKEKKEYAGGVQGANLLPLFYGFLEGEEYKTVRQNLIDGYKQSKRFDTGIVLTPVLLEILTRWGETELCYQLFTASGKPSFRYMLEGETTLCEHWNKKWPGDTRESGELVGADVSHCHPVFGSVVSWMYKHIAGLDLSGLCNNQVVVYPKFTKEIKRAFASKETKYGKISVEYCAENSLEMKVVVPYGLTCLVVFNQKNTGGFTVNGKEYTKALDKDGNYLIVLHGGSYLIR